MFHRRSFLRRSAAAAATPALMGAAPNRAFLVIDPADPLTRAEPVQWAVSELESALRAKGYKIRRVRQAKPGDGLSVLICGSRSLPKASPPVPTEPESFLLIGAPDGIIVCGADTRGLMYAVLELADRVRYGAVLGAPAVHRPANPVRSVMRQFVSELYDKPWYYDRAMWPQYLGMLAASRFNRFDLTFGLGYDALKNVADPYFVFTYPFLMAVPGYDVKVTNLSDAERDRNLAALRFISEQTVAHGLDFQLGLWMHGYQWLDTPNAKYVVTGLSKDNHAAYCRDALTALLKALPAVSSVGLRIHGESGVAEGSYDFWNAVFQGVGRCGRTVEIDLHAKGIDDTMTANALATGMPVNIAPKFAAEHIGLPYHQADIRPSEIPAAGQIGKGLMGLSEGQRSFTRYGYADLMRDDRKYTVRTRVFYGTQRILASGGAEAAAAYGRAFQFCGMTGGELLEPLTYRGRRGSSVPGSRRSGYISAKLEPKYDWQKYEYWYRSFGRMLFSPESNPEECKRSFGPAGASARHIEDALAAASRILPLVTHAISESAACDLYWPEIDWGIPLASEAPKMFWDTPSPRIFQNVTALDPQMFSSCSEFAGELLGERSGKYAPTEVAMRLDAFVRTARADLTAAGDAKSVDAMRLAIDIEIQALLGTFFAEKLRTGVLYALYERSGDRRALSNSLKHYGLARAAWASIVDRAKGIYAADLSISDRTTERGQWADRLKGIDDDIAALNAKLATASPGKDPRIESIVNSLDDLFTHVRPPLPCKHTPPAAFAPGQPVDLTIAVREGLTRASLWYRHVNQAERWTSADMNSSYDGWRAGIPAATTNSPYPLQYYFEFRAAPDRAWLYPGFDDGLLNQPYFVLRRA